MRARRAHDAAGLAGGAAKGEAAVVHRLAAAGGRDALLPADPRANAEEEEAGQEREGGGEGTRERFVGPERVFFGLELLDVLVGRADVEAADLVLGLHELLNGSDVVLPVDLAEDAGAHKQHEEDHGDHLALLDLLAAAHRRVPLRQLRHADKRAVHDRAADGAVEAAVAQVAAAPFAQVLIGGLHVEGDDGWQRRGHCWHRNDDRVGHTFLCLRGP
mmetsp:Transcript_27835/g.91541  ORF Transcript_27835/g.91541 Transcript_27835/m.91541 type:complete len:217 (+) Transcript_27835:152-802(+)